MESFGHGATRISDRWPVWSQCALCGRRRKLWVNLPTAMNRLEAGRFLSESFREGYDPQDCEKCGLKTDMWDG